MPIWCIVWSSVPVLAVKIVLPEYVADTECAPTDNEDTTNEALPPVRVTGLPMTVPLTRNCIVPIGISEPETGATVAVKFTGCPKSEGLSDDVMVVVVPILLTVCASTALVLGKLFASPT